MTKIADEKYPATYRYDGDDLPNRDAPAQREAFDAGMQHALDLLVDLFDDYGYWSTIDFDKGHQEALRRAISRLSEDLEGEEDPRG